MPSPNEAKLKELKKTLTNRLEDAFEYSPTSLVTGEMWGFLNRAFQLGRMEEREKTIKVVRSHLDHKEPGRRDFNIVEEYAYNRAIYDILKVLNVATNPVSPVEGEE